MCFSLQPPPAPFLVQGCRALLPPQVLLAHRRPQAHLAFQEALRPPPPRAWRERRSLPQRREQPPPKRQEKNSLQADAGRAGRREGADEECELPAGAFPFSGRP